MAINQKTVGDIKKYLADFADDTLVWIESDGELEPVMNIEDHENGVEVVIVGEI